MFLSLVTACLSRVHFASFQSEAMCAAKQILAGRHWSALLNRLPAARPIACYTTAADQSVSVAQSEVNFFDHIDYTTLLYTSSQL
jgi:hypothetical protein